MTTPTQRSTVAEIGRNVLVIAGAYAASFLVVQVTQRISPESMLTPAASLGVLLAGLVAAVIFRARPAAYLLAAFVAFEGSELVFHFIYGIRSVQSAPVHYAVLAAGALGIVLGAFIRSDPKPSVRRTVVEPESRATAG